MTGHPIESEIEQLTCLFCGEPERFEITDIYADHTVTVTCCCEALQEQVLADVAADPAWGRELMRRAGAERLTGHELRRLADDGIDGWILDWQLRIRPVPFAAARRFVGEHHIHCGEPAAWRYGAAITNGWSTIGVVMVGNPIARAYNGRGMLEVNRLCIRRDLPPALAWNAASELLGWSAREARKRGYGKIITYTRIDEKGTSLTAVGWTCEGRAGGGSWHSERRRRGSRNAFVPKLRWSRTFPRKLALAAKPEPAPAARLPFAIDGEDWLRSALLEP